MFAYSIDFSTWEYFCGEPLIESTVRGMEKIIVELYPYGTFVTMAQVGGGGEYGGLAFGACDTVIVYTQIEYFTSCYYCKEGDYQYAWAVGRGIDTPQGCNVVFNMAKSIAVTSTDYLTLSAKTSEISEIDGSRYSNVWAVLSQPADNLYHFDGSDWEMKTETWMNESLYGVWVHESGDVFAVGSNGAIYHYNGSVWEDQSIELETAAFYGVWGFSADDVFVVGERAKIYHYDGAGWGAVRVSPEVDATLYGVHGGDVGGVSRVFCAGQNGTIVGFPIEPLP
jgi:hypothetical protein